MPISEDTDKTPIVLKILSHRFLKQLDTELQRSSDTEGRVFADIAFSLRGKSKPKTFRLTLERLTYQGEC